MLDEHFFTSLYSSFVIWFHASQQFHSLSLSLLFVLYLILTKKIDHNDVCQFSHHPRIKVTIQYSQFSVRVCVCVSFSFFSVLFCWSWVIVYPSYASKSWLLNFWSTCLFLLLLVFVFKQVLIWEIIKWNINVSIHISFEFHTSQMDTSQDLSSHR